MPTVGVTLCVIPRVPPEGLTAFHAYEAVVPPVLGDHGGMP
jgi:hypothetical protein